MVLHIYPQFHPQNFCLIVLLMWMLFSLLLTTSLCLFSHSYCAPAVKRSYPPPSKNIPLELFFAKLLASRIEKHTTRFSPPPAGTAAPLLGWHVYWLGKTRRLPLFDDQSECSYTLSVQKRYGLSNDKSNSRRIDRAEYSSHLCR